MQQLSFDGAEIWKPVVGYVGFYEVSDLGRVRSLPRLTRTGCRVRGTVLKPSAKKAGHLHVVLCVDGTQKWKHVHQLVAAAFIGPCPEGQEVRHKDGKPSNNAALNLEYGTRGDNFLDQRRHGTHIHGSKTHCDNGHEFTPQNTKITTRPDGSFRQRVCVKCCRKAGRDYMRRKRAEAV